MISRFFLSHLEFDFLQGKEKELRDNIPANVEKYNKILETICKEPEKAVIAGGFFLKTRGRQSQIDIYMFKPLKYYYEYNLGEDLLTPECLELLKQKHLNNNLAIRHTSRPDQNCNIDNPHLFINLETFQLKIEEQRGGFSGPVEQPLPWAEIILRFTPHESLEKLLESFTFSPSAIAYSYAKQKEDGRGLIVSNWYSTNPYEELFKKHTVFIFQYEKKGFDVFSQVYYLYKPPITPFIHPISCTQNNPISTWAPVKPFSLGSLGGFSLNQP